MVSQIIEELPESEVCVISQDSYYKDTSHLSYEERVKINFDHPQAIDFELLVAHLKELRKGNPIDQPVYSFVSTTVLPIPLRPTQKGGHCGRHPILTHPDIREMFDVKLLCMQIVTSGLSADLKGTYQKEEGPK